MPASLRPASPVPRREFFIGISAFDHALLGAESGRAAGEYAATGNAHSIAANRLSYLLDLRGPSVAVDTACSSSLVAVDLAMQSLRLGRCEIALAGGVNLVLAPYTTRSLAATGAMAADGRCKVFSADADGYVRSEGAAVVVLKRLADAELDGDRILAVLLGSAVNQDGRTNGLTAPNPAAQRAVMRAALADAGVPAQRVGYVEAHAAGTPLGDPIEVASIAAVFGDGRHVDNVCAIGSVKANVGHLEAAAGIAGMIKAVLALQHGRIPGMPNIRAINPQIQLRDSQFRIATTAMDWPRGDRPRVAAVSSFGFGGTNAHVVLTEAPPRQDQATAIDRPLHVLALSARTGGDLRALARRYGAWFDGQPPATRFADVCFTAGTGREEFGHRLAIVAADGRAAQAELAELAQSATPEPDQPSRRAVCPSIAFVFQGQGAQFPGMAAELYRTQPTFRRDIDRCAALTAPYLDRPLLSVMFGGVEAAPVLNRPIYAQAALFAVGHGLATLWRSWGIEPDCLIGHSAGEYTAACLAGALSLEDALWLVIERGRLMETLPRGGAMATVFASKEAVERLLTGSDVVIAASNSDQSTVIAGPEVDLAALLEQFDAAGIGAATLNVPFSAHSPAVDPILDAFARSAGQVAAQPLVLPLASTLDAEMLPPGAVLDANYWRRHLRAPVRFADAVATARGAGISLFLELGPTAVLTTIGTTARAGEEMWLASLRRDRNDWPAILGSLATLFARGATVDWRGFDRGYPRQPLALPTYPFSHTALASTSLASTEGAAMSDGAIVFPSMTAAAISRRPMNNRPTVSALQALLAALLDEPAEALDPAAPLLALGVDSIVLARAAQLIHDRFGVAVAPRDLFGGLDTIDKLAAHIDRLGGSANPSAEAATATEPAAPPPRVQSAPSPALSRDAPPVPESIAKPPAAAQSPMLLEGPAMTSPERIMHEQLQVVTRVINAQLATLGRLGLALQTLEPATANPPAAIPPNAIPAALPATPVPPDGSAPRILATVPRHRTIAPRESGMTPPSVSRREEHLAAFVRRYNARTRLSKDFAQQHRAAHADFRSSVIFSIKLKELVYPLVAETASGARIRDIDGNEYVDMTMGFGVNLLGHNPPFLRDAIAAQLSGGMLIGPRSPLVADVVTLIRELTGVERVAFANTGSEAVMAALRLARTTTSRRRIAMFAGAYHGLHDSVLAARNPMGGGTDAMPADPGIPEGMLRDTSILEYGSVAALDFVRRHGTELAAVIVEPVQSRRPSLQPRTFLHELRRITRETGTALIFDEAVTGFRLHPSGAQAWFDVRADLVVYGKVLGGGMPIGVVGGDASFMDATDGGPWQFGDGSYPARAKTFFSGTFARHPLALAAARAMLRHLKAAGPSLQEQLNARATAFAEGISDFLAERGLPVAMHNCGSVLHLNFPVDLGRSIDTSLLFYHLAERGVYIWEGRTCFLSAAHTDADLAFVRGAIEESVRELQDAGYLRPDGCGVARPDTIARAVERPAVAPVVTAIRAAQATLPLTESQEQLWVLAQMGAGFEPVVLDVAGPLDHTRLARAFTGVAARHDALRTVFDREGNYQRVLPPAEVSPRFVDLSLEPATAEAALVGAVREEAARPFDLAAAPPWRVLVLKLEPARHRLVFTAHHVIVDGWSTALVLDEVFRLYTGQPAAELAPVLQFPDFVAWQWAFLSGAAAKADEEFWLRELAELPPPLALATSRPRAPVKSYRGARTGLMLDRGVLTEARLAATRESCTLFVLLIAVYGELLHRVGQRDDIVTGFSTGGRTMPGSETLVGLCSHVVPLRLRYPVDESCTAYLARVREAVLEASEHAGIPFARILNRLNPRRDPGAPPLVGATFNLEPPIRLPQSGALSVTLLPAEIGFSGGDIHLNATELPNGLLLHLDYDSDLFDPATANRILENYRTLLEAMVAAAPAASRSSLPILGPAERWRLLNDWSNTSEEEPAVPGGFLARFAASAVAHPDAVAVTAADGMLSYGELERRSSQLARYLVSLGVGAETRVALLTERTTSAIVGLLGIMKAGGAFVPLDPVHPGARVAALCADAGARFAVTESAFLDSLAGLTAVCLDRDRTVIAAYDAAPIGVFPESGALAYQIYTSGSTGAPKGVEVEHGQINSYTGGILRRLDLPGGRRFGFVSSMAVDLGYTAIFASLASAGTLVITPRGVIDAAGLAAFFVTHPIDVLKIAPSHLSALLAADEAASVLPGSTLILGGERLDWGLVARVRALAPVAIYNHYGPTEATIGAVCGLVPEAPTSASVPLGRPLPNARVYVLTDTLQPAPQGVSGELAIGGSGVARGYANDPALSTVAFLPDPFDARPGARLYRTGDIIRFLPDGSLEYLRRADAQIKNSRLPGGAGRGRGGTAGRTRRAGRGGCGHARGGRSHPACRLCRGVRDGGGRIRAARRARGPVARPHGAGFDRPAGRVPPVRQRQDRT